MKPESADQEEPFYRQGTSLLGSDTRLYWVFCGWKYKGGGVFFQGVRIPEPTSFCSFVQFFFFFLAAPLGL